MIYSFKSITELKLQILCQANAHAGVREVLAKYLKRWPGESVADNIQLISSLVEKVPGVPLIAPSYLDELPENTHIVNSIGQLTHYDLRRHCIDITVNYTKDVAEARLWLNSFPYVVAFDTESTGLSVQLDEITMYSFAYNEQEAFVISNESEEMQDLVLTYIVEAKHKWLIHNASYDLKLVHWHTGKFPADFEDTQLSTFALTNNTNSLRTKLGLKANVAKIDPDYAVAKDLFGIENKYNAELIDYSGKDATYTYFLWIENERKLGKSEHPINFNNLLPVVDPAVKESRQSERFFYQNVMLPLVPTMVKIMNQGMLLDMEKVTTLQEKLDVVLNNVQTTLNENRVIQKFQTYKYSMLKKTYIEERKSKQRSVAYYTKPYKPTDMTHRSFLVNYLLTKYSVEVIANTAKLPTGHRRWSVADIKAIASEGELAIMLTAIVDKSMPITHVDVVRAMAELALVKSDLYNSKYLDDIASVSRDSLLPEFSPSSPKQKQELFEFLGIPPISISKTSGEASWNRAAIEELLTTQKNEGIIEILHAFEEHSTSAIVRNNFIKNFQEKTIDGVLRGNFRLGGTKSFRLSSNSPNLLNLPSTGSALAKPVKECFIAPKGFIVFGIDADALQEVTAANLTHDKNKVKILSEGFDSHCLHATAYYPEVEQILGKDDGSLAWNKNFKAQSKVNKRLGELRQMSKPVSFKMMFSGFPDAHKGGAITQEIFDKFHNVLYPGITNHNRDVIMKDVQETGEVYLGLGLRCKTDDPKKYERTIKNIYIQFWDTISIITCNQIQDRIDKANRTEDIQITSSIYDSIYFNCRDNLDTIKWLNDNIVPLLTQKIFTNQLVPNAAKGQVGTNWSNLTDIENNASLGEISATLTKIKEA